jgi:hypothetical protein
MVYLTSLQTRILVNGRPIKQYYDGKGGTWVEARDNSKYTVEVKNNSNERVLAVVSVDGINVISGKEAEVKAEDGYVINPYSNLVIDGWRVSDAKVKEFFFSFNREAAYAVKVGGDQRNLGVIGVAFFSEKQYNYIPFTWSYPVPPIYPPSPQWTTLGGSSTAREVKINNIVNECVDMCCTSSDQASYSVESCVQKSSLTPQPGTGKGNDVLSRVTEVTFNTDQLVGTTTLYYDTFNNLAARGILKSVQYPSPFKQTGYCPDI